jgi:5'-3' exonuclease
VVGERIVCVDRVRRTLRDEQGVHEKFGVGPASIPDYLALVGDTADGIPGLKGWGAKSTATVLAHYGHVEKIPDDAKDWAVAPRGAAKLAERLAAQREEVALYKHLATLRTDVPLAEDLDALRWRGAYREDLGVLCEELEDSDLMERIPLWRDD